MTLKEQRVRLSFDTAAFTAAIERAALAFERLGVALGMPTRAELEQQRRIEQHLARCADRRERRRKQSR